MDLIIVIYSVYKHSRLASLLFSGFRPPTSRSIRGGPNASLSLLLRKNYSNFLKKALLKIANKDFIWHKPVTQNRHQISNVVALAHQYLNIIFLIFFSWRNTSKYSISPDCSFKVSLQNLLFSIIFATFILHINSYSGTIHLIFLNIFFKLKLCKYKSVFLDSVAC